jgi:hypothetical protein
MAVTRFYTSKAIRYTPGFLASAACGAEVPVRRSFSEMRMARALAGSAAGLPKISRPGQDLSDTATSAQIVDSALRHGEKP